MSRWVQTGSPSTSAGGKCALFDVTHKPLEFRAWLATCRQRARQQRACRPAASRIGALQPAADKVGHSPRDPELLGAVARLAQQRFECHDGAEKGGVGLPAEPCLAE